MLARVTATILEVNNLKRYIYNRFSGSQHVQALKMFPSPVETGEFVAIMGNPVPGKDGNSKISLAALDEPTSGEVLLNGKSIVKNPRKKYPRSGEVTWALFFQDFSLP